MNENNITFVGHIVWPLLFICSLAKLGRKWYALQKLCYCPIYININKSIAHLVHWGQSRYFSPRFEDKDICTKTRCFFLHAFHNKAKETAIVPSWYLQLGLLVLVYMLRFKSHCPRFWWMSHVRNVGFSDKPPPGTNIQHNLFDSVCLIKVIRAIVILGFYKKKIKNVTNAYIFQIVREK